DPISVDVETQNVSHVRPAASAPLLTGWRAVRPGGDRQLLPARNVNSIDEVPDSSWFTNRIGSRPLSVYEIAQGPDTLSGPLSGPWIVLAGKTDGVSPGLQLKDSAGRRFFVKFDPVSNPEMASGAEVVATKLLFALGYHVPENSIVTFRRDELTVGSAAAFRDPTGKKRPMPAAD